MIMASGALAVLQMTVIPGLLLLLGLRIRCASRMAQGIAVVSTSLLLNYFLVVGLTACGQYKRSHVVIVMVAELLALAIWAWRSRNQPRSSDSLPAEAAP